MQSAEQKWELARQRVDQGSNLDEDEEKQARELSSARAHIIHEVVAREGEEEMERSTQALAWSGLAAGLTMGLSFIASGILLSHIDPGPHSVLIYSLGYPLGFIAAIIGRQQLFTEDTLTPIVPLLNDPRRAVMMKVLRLWSVVFATNFIGAMLFGWVCAKTSLVDEPVRSALFTIAQRGADGSFGEFVIKGIAAGWVIALLTWMLSGLKHGEVPMIFLMMYLVGVGHFAHVVIGSCEAGFLIAAGAQGWGHALGGFVLPTLIGNTIGGVTLVALINHAQVTAGESK